MQPEKLLEEAKQRLIEGRANRVMAGELASAKRKLAEEIKARRELEEALAAAKQELAQEKMRHSLCQRVLAIAHKQLEALTKQQLSHEKLVKKARHEAPPIQVGWTVGSAGAYGEAHSCQLHTTGDGMGRFCFHDQ